MLELPRPYGPPIFRFLEIVLVRKPIPCHASVLTTSPWNHYGYLLRASIGIFNLYTTRACCDRVACRWASAPPPAPKGPGATPLAFHQLCVSTRGDLCCKPTQIKVHVLSPVELRDPTLYLAKLTRTLELLAGLWSCADLKLRLPMVERMGQESMHVYTGHMRTSRIGCHIKAHGLE